jgi:hypothetical protein
MHYPVYGYTEYTIGEKNLDYTELKLLGQGAGQLLVSEWRKG